MNNSTRITGEGARKCLSGMVKAVESIKTLPDSFIKKPDGMFGAVAKIKCGTVTIDSSELDLEFTVPFDDDLEPNEAEIIIYNLTKDTIAKFTRGKKLSIEAGFTGDTGVVFSGYIDRVSTKTEGADKTTTIKCVDDASSKTLESIAYAAGTKASYILKDLLGKTGLPIAVFKPKRDFAYENEQTVDGDLMQNIKKYSEVCGVSTYILKGKVYCRHISEGDNVHFQVSEETGMIGSPAEYQEEVTAEDFKDVIDGFDIEMLLQHRMQTAAIVTVKSETANGKFRVRSGQHVFNESEATTKVKVM